MKILIVDTFYGPYLERLYAGGVLAQQPWCQQHQAHFAGGFGTGDAYSHGLGLLGVEAIEIVANSAALQQAWAREHHPALLQLEPGGQQLLAILEAQIRWWRPTVLYVQDINWLPAAFLQHVKPLVPMVVGQNACPLAPNLDLSPYDLLLTSLPHYVGRFRKQGVDAAYFPIGFDQRLLQRHNTHGPRPHEFTFVGGLGGYHSQGTQMLEAIAQELPLQVWGYGGQQLPAGSILKQRWQGEAWADDMYGLLAGSQITLNRHIDIAESYANNMRLYEATGMGACLVTDAKANLATLFEPDQEVVTYRTPQEAISKVQQLLAQPAQSAAIAARGQARTLRDHTYNQRMALLVELLQRPHPPLQQHIVLACSAAAARHMPVAVHERLKQPHRHHRVTVLSNAALEDTDLLGVSRWCVPADHTAVEVAGCCLDALEPTTVITLEPSGVDRSWLEPLRQKASQHGIAVVTKKALAS
jgi:spore maturation protein CgeB